MMQQAVVAVVVLVAAFAVVRRYAPPAWKTFWRGFAARGARSLGLEAMAARLESPPPAKPDCASACATCSGCDLVGKTSATEYIVLIQRVNKP